MKRIILFNLILLTILYCDIDFNKLKKAINKKDSGVSSATIDFNDLNKKSKQEWKRKIKENEKLLQKYRQLDNKRAKYGLSKSLCYRVSGSYALYRYCTTGDCSGFVSNYALYQLCKYDNINGFYGSDRKTNIRLYLENGGYLSYDYFSEKAAYQSGKHNDTFQNRKNFILYLLSGHILIKY